jgi:hypothetical protein
MVFCAEDVKYPLPGIHNAFFASYAKSPVIKHIINDIVSNIRNRFYGINPLSITGPHEWGTSLNGYLSRNINSKFQRKAIIDKSGNKMKLVEYVSYEWKDLNNN